MDQIDELLSRGVANIIPSKQELEKALRSGKKLNIYLGIDPTATHIHLGHAFPLRQLQRFADLGHHVTFLIGSFTALIGDTSDKDTERPVLTIEQIEDNFHTYKSQAEKVLDFSKVHVVYNGEWLKQLSFEDIVKLTQHFSVGDFVGRELIRRRLQENKRVGLHEVLYPVMQGYDSYHLDTDVQIGGTDQTFNMQAGRTLQKDLRGKESFVMTNEFLMGTDGRKMSKSWGNAIWLDDSPEDMFAKSMAINDDLIVQYFTLATNLSSQQINDIAKELEKTDNPMPIKKMLARQIVTELNSAEAAERAEQAFEKQVQRRELPEEIEERTVSKDSLINEDLLVSLKLVNSKAEAKRLIQQGGVSINEQKIAPGENSNVSDGSLLKVGKRRIVRLKVK